MNSQAAGWARRAQMRLVPKAYWESATAPRTLARAFGIAIAIRFVLMPFFCHRDLISTYHRSFDVMRGLAPQYWTPHELIQAFFLALYQPFLALQELVGWRGLPTASFEFWLETFAPHPQVFSALFLFKLPYLLCDLGIGLVLLRIFEDTPRKGVAAASLWLFNPVTIFSFYVFGRHDAVAILFVALGLLALKRSRSVLGALSIGVAIWSRYWPAFILPFLVAFDPGDWRRKLKVLVAALLPMAIFNVVVQVAVAARRAGGVPTRQGVAEIQAPTLYMSQTTFVDYLLGMNVSMDSIQGVFLFPIAWALLAMFALVSKSRGDLLTRFSTYAFCCLSILYAMTFVHPQYFTWAILFLVILRAQSKTPVLQYLHYLQVLCMIPYTFYWKRPLFGFLLAPLDPEYFASISAPADWIAEYVSPFVVANLFRTLLTVTCLFMAGWVLFGERERAANPEP